MIINLSEQLTIASKFISELRDINIQKDRMRFRYNLERLGEIFAYEISKSLEYGTREVETPFGIANTRFLADRLIVSALLRAGLPLHKGILNYFDEADSAFITSYRMHHKDGSFEVKLEYITSPSLEGAVLIIADPMIATGSSLKKSLDALYEYGTPKSIHIVSVIATTEGIHHIQRFYPKTRFWIGEMDEELTAKSYIVPGIGDAGDLCFGDKMFE